MYRNWRIERFACAAMLVASLRPATASAQAMKRRPTLTPALAATRAALDKYKDPMQAVRDGYFSTVACIFGQTLMGPMEGHQPIMPEGLHHWDLHVWLWKDNPNGVFSPTNSAVKCPATGYGYSFDDAPPKVVKP